MMMSVCFTGFKEAKCPREVQESVRISAAQAKMSFIDPYQHIIVSIVFFLGGKADVFCVCVYAFVRVCACAHACVCVCVCACLCVHISGNISKAETLNYLIYIILISIMLYTRQWYILKQTHVFWLL